MYDIPRKPLYPVKGIRLDPLSVNLLRAIRDETGLTEAKIVSQALGDWLVRVPADIRVGILKQVGMNRMGVDVWDFREEIVVPRGAKARLRGRKPKAAR